MSHPVNYRKYIAESLGTLLLVFIGAGAVCANYSLNMAGGQGAVFLYDKILLEKLLPVR
jgi:glycerol uptake facilitator-like aquaporin